ncbi:MAG: MFS transporter [Actinomycetota bacterium]
MRNAQEFSALSDTVSISPRRTAFGPLRHRDFAWVWSGAFVSNSGTWLQNVALQWTMYSITKGSAFWVAMVTFVQFFPILIFGLHGGLAADRHERRLVLIVTQSVLMASAFGLAALSFAHSLRVATIVPLVAVGGIALAFNAPAYHSLISDLVPTELLPDAVSLNTAQLSASRVVGPLVGGVVYAAIGAAWVFFANGVSFLAVIFPLALIRPRSRPRMPRESRQIYGGLQILTESPSVRLLMYVTALVSLFGAPVIALLAVIAGKVLGLKVFGFGILFSIFSVGAVVGALSTGALLRRVGMFGVVIGNLAAMTGALLVIGLAHNFSAIATCLAVIGFGYTQTVSATNSGAQLSVDQGTRGRLMSLYMMSWAGVFPIGSLIAGTIGAKAGVQPTMIACGVLLGLGTIAIIVRGRALASVPIPG